MTPDFKKLTVSVQKQALGFGLGGLVFGAALGAIYAINGAWVGIIGGAIAGLAFGVGLGIVTFSTLKQLPEKPPLHPDEELLTQRVPANYLGTGGALYLTNHGLHFMSHHLNGRKNSNLHFFVPFAEISKATRLPISLKDNGVFTGGLMPRLGVHTKQGGCLAFNVYQLNAWVEVLNKMTK